MALNRVLYRTRAFEPGVVILQYVIRGNAGTTALEGKGGATVTQGGANAPYVLTIPGFDSNNFFTMHTQIIDGPGGGFQANIVTAFADPIAAPNQIQLQMFQDNTATPDQLGATEFMQVTVFYKNSGAQ